MPVHPGILFPFLLLQWVSKPDYPSYFCFLLESPGNILYFSSTKKHEEIIKGCHSVTGYYPGHFSLFLSHQAENITRLGEESLWSLPLPSEELQSFPMISDHSKPCLLFCHFHLAPRLQLEIRSQGIGNLLSALSSKVLPYWPYFSSSSSSPGKLFHGMLQCLI